MMSVDVRRRDVAAAPYKGSQPRDMRPDLVVADVWPHDDRLWVPLDDGVWSRPLQFDVSHGQYSHLMRVTRQGIIARHRHTGPVLAYVVSGCWNYLEHDWMAEEGSFAFEPPGETHTLVVPDGCKMMAAIFHVTGSLIYVTPDGMPIGYDDVFTRLEKARAHFEAVGLDESELSRLVH